MKKYDVAIYGLWYGNNYGSIITYYALSKVVESMGLTYAMIRNPLGREINIDELDRSHPLRFAKEKYEITPLLPLNKLSELNESFDTFLLGSDQMWNYNLSKPYKQSYFFDFVADDKRKVSYATSFGKDTYIGPADEKILTEKNLKRFDAVSVRDDFSKRICENNFDVRAELVLDPVFLCPVDEYEKLIEEATDFNIDEDYIFSYILDPNPKIGKSIQKISEETGKKVVVVFNQTGDMEALRKRLEITSDRVEFRYSVTVKEWLYLYKNALYVLTDSFHGTCFSIIFKKKFISMRNNGRGGSRFPFLLGTFGLMDYMIEKPEDFVEKFHTYGLEHSINYDSVENILVKERTRCYNWLKNILISPKCSNELLKQRNIISAVKNIRENSVEGVKINCTGCSACAAVCPKDAIVMTENREGFLKPSVNFDSCINCGICVKKCIDINPSYNNNALPECYAMMANDDVRKISSSGGMFTVAAEYILDKGGYVCGAGYKDDFTVEHIIINNKNDLSLLRGSKYMQSHIGNIYSDIKELLENDKYVLFTGMPCQVAGLYSYLGKDYEKLYSIDLLCHGITSSKVFEKYHTEILAGKKLTRLEFKEKEPWGWHAGINAYFEDGTKYQKPLESDLYFIAYLKSISKNTTCGVCKMNKLPRQGDLSIGDFWGIQKSDNDMYDGKGTSVVLVNNDKAKRFFNELKPAMYKWKEEKLDDAINGNRIIKGPYKLHKNRNLFFENFDSLDFRSLTLGCYNDKLSVYKQNKLSEIVPSEIHDMYYIAKTAVENSKGRQIVMWLYSPTFDKMLQKYFGIKTAFTVTKDANKVVDGKIIHISELKDASDKYYVVAIHPEYSRELYSVLEKMGYSEINDFIFRKHKPVVLENFDCSNQKYSDAYGNTIEGGNAIIGKIVFRGCNNHIVIGKENIRTSNLEFDVTENTVIQIGNNNRFNGKLRFVSLGYEGKSIIKINDNCRFTDGIFRLYNSKHVSSVTIDEKCTFETNLEIHANVGKKIVIGRDCMFSHDVELWAGDGHTIFDVETGKNTNSDYENLPDYKNRIVIGEHVWIAKGAFIMHGTNIGNGSIVGARSVVKGKYSNNCTIAGNPAKMVKNNVAWSREMTAIEPLNSIDSSFYKKSSDSNAPISGMNVLVIGGTRFIGIQLVRKLISLGNKVTIANRGNNRDNFGLFVDRIIMDVSNEESVKKAIRDKYYDVVFDNVSCGSLGVNNVLSNVKCKKYIQLSSIAVYNLRTINMSESLFDPMSHKLELRNIPLNYGSKEYGMGKRLAESIAYQKFSKNISVVSVRIPYVAPTDRLYSYCENIVNDIPMSINDTSASISFVNDQEIGDFLPWIAAQNFEGPINFASIESITLDEIIRYIEKKTNKKAIIDEKGKRTPFNEKSYSLNIKKLSELKFFDSDVEYWIWDLIDKYIDKALRLKG